MKDAQLIEKIIKGDVYAFESLFRQQYSPLCNYALRYVQSKEVSEEIIQELFYKLWKTRKNLSIDLNVDAYLFKATYRNCMEYIRNKKTQLKHQKQIFEQSDHKLNPKEAEVREINELVSQTLNQLPYRTLQIFKLSRYEGLKYKEIAERLSISIKTVEANMAKALKLFRSNLKDYLGSA